MALVFHHGIPIILVVGFVSLLHFGCHFYYLLLHIEYAIIESLIILLLRFFDLHLNIFLLHLCQRQQLFILLHNRVGHILLHIQQLFRCT